MSEFNNKLSELYKSLATSQKNTKGDPHKGDSMANFRGKKGVSDVGIPLSPKAAKKKATNRAGYNYPQHLRNINERREREAMQRHGITDKNNPFNAKKKNHPCSQQLDQIVVCIGSHLWKTHQLLKEKIFIIGVMKLLNLNR